VRAVSERHNDRVRVKSLSRGVVELPWTSRIALFEEIRHLVLARPIIDAFEAVGVSRPVILTHAQKVDLVTLLDFWGSQNAGGLKGLPEGLYELRDALHDDLHETQKERS